MDLSGLSGDGNPRKVRTFSLRKPKDDQPPISQRVKLERVLGLTVTTNAALDCEPHTGLIAYPAGCTVVLLHARRSKQWHVINNSKNTLTAVAFSACGRYLATGEGGHQPCLRVWDLQDKTQVAEFPGHKYGINCVAFSPNNKYVVSVGSQHDMIVNVWEWRGQVKVASNKVSAKVKAISFAENGSYFVTVGNRHVKFWYLEYSRSNKYKEPVPLMGRSAILGEQRNNYFCDVACGRGEMGDSTYAITKSGLLCEFNNRRLLDKWVELRTKSANCLVVGEEYIFIGCADGIVRCFSPFTLQFVTTLPRTHYLGVDVSKGLSISHMASHPANSRYPDTIAVTYDNVNHRVTCVYSDHSIYIWDTKDIRKVGKSHSFLYHSACIWGIDVYPEHGEGSKALLPPGSFVTCSSDDTIRVWNMDPNMSNNTLYKRNIYSNELLKTLYVDSELQYLCCVDYNPAGSTDKTDTLYDSRNGVRSIRVSPDGKHLASGDRSGNIRIHELQFMDEICKIEAHDAEVLCLEYNKGNADPKLLASASRDRLIHVFDSSREYQFLQTLGDHSSSITAVRFLRGREDHPLQMLSCGADKSIIFRQAQKGANGMTEFSRSHHVVGKSTLYDMEVDPNQKHLLTACQDRSIRVYNVTSGKHSKTFKGSLGDNGTLIKLILDNSGSYVATSCTDKNMYVVENSSGETVATMGGHSELVTGMKFTNDGKHLISVSGDGCIFIWRLPTDITQNIVSKKEREYRREPFSVGDALDNEQHEPPPALVDSNANDIETSDYRFNVTQLPFWAKKQISENMPLSRETEKTVDFSPKGRWAQRLGDTQNITFRSIYESDSLIPFPNDKSKLMMESDSSKESSLEGSGPDLHRVSSFKKETIISKQERISGLIDDRAASPSQIAAGMMIRRGVEVPGLNAATDDSSVGSPKHEDGGYTGDDGDVEDYSELDIEDGGESTEPEQSEPKLMYLPQNADNDSEFTVNATNEAELRKSQRRSKKRPIDLALPPLSTMSVSGSQESDDEDDISTPSADTTDKNITSGLSCSTESLDQVGKRDNFLKNNYESLEGNPEPEREEKHKPILEAKPSFSSRFLTRSNSRNAHLIQDTKTLKPEASKRREELQKQLEETRKKLQSIGYKSNLRNSRSITDLSHLSDQEGSTASRGPLREESNTSGGGGGGLRRACSLSDLSKSGNSSSHSGPRRLLPNPPVQVSGRKGSNIKSSPRASVQPIRVNPVAPLHRSSSTSQLHQSDSENEVMLKGGMRGQRKPSGTSPSAMRPTISSSNKVLNKVGPTGRRRSGGLTSATSVTDLRQHHHQDDSSSEEGDHTRSTSIERSKTTTSKVTVTASRRSSLANHRASSERDVSSLNKTARDVTQRLTAVTKTRQETVMRRTTTQSRKPKHTHVNSGESPTMDNMESSMKELSGLRTLPAPDVSSSALSRELCEQAAYTVQSSCDDLVQLYRRVSLATDLPESVRTDYMGILWRGTLGAQRSLVPLSSWSGKSGGNNVMQDLLVNMMGNGNSS